ncbi:hypothetical protein AAFF_G00207090 [Aldrovandia affinis]|uniref:Uncharacterized protein n=1 Tax=Aldrovandia affinis TaxID=143900 RepID=A0AAD7RH62_9TELE|nr:hypothetical protein AAFF_G00207090 [Aldrovandia affinis]
MYREGEGTASLLVSSQSLAVKQAQKQRQSEEKQACVQTTKRGGLVRRLAPKRRPQMSLTRGERLRALDPARTGGQEERWKASEEHGVRSEPGPGRFS